MRKLGIRETEVLKYLCEGYSNIEIGNFLNISRHTVKVHVTNILRALDAKDRTNAAYIAGKMDI